MKRPLVLLAFVASLALGMTFMSGAHTVAQDQTEPEATISALETKVAELEAQLTPTVGTEPTSDAGVDDSGKVFGPALELLPAGEPGRASVVLVGPYGTWLPVVVRNNTTKRLGRVEVSAAAYSADGVLIGAGSSLEIQPAIIEPSGYGIGNVSFSFLELPLDAVFEFKVEGVPDAEPNLLYDLTIANASFQGDRIVGEISNQTGMPIANNAQVMFACLDESGALVTVDMVYSADSSIQPDDTAVFQIDEYDKPCELFLLTATGYSST